MLRRRRRRMRGLIEATRVSAESLKEMAGFEWARS